MALSIALYPALCRNIALDDLGGHIPRRGGEIAAGPERREATQDRIFLAEMMRREPFALLDHFCGRIGRPRAHEEVDMIRLNRQLHNRPALLGTLLLDEQATVLGNRAAKDRFAPLGTPDEMVDDKVDTVFISLVFHVDTVSYNNSAININVLGDWLKPGRP